MFTNQAGVLAALLSSNWCQTARTASAYSPKYSLSSAAFASSLSLSSTGRSTSAIKRCCTACRSSTTSSTVHSGFWSQNAQMGAAPSTASTQALSTT